MKHMKRIFFSIDGLLFTFLALFCVSAFAQEAVDPADFLGKVLKFIQSWGGLATMLKVSGIILLVISSMKVSILNQLVWSKLGKAQAWLGPILGLAAGITGLGMSGHVSAASIFAYIAAGAGAIPMHELLDTAKAIPGLGAVYVALINMVEGMLGKAPSA